MKVIVINIVRALKGGLAKLAALFTVGILIVWGVTSFTDIWLGLAAGGVYSYAIFCFFQAGIIEFDGMV